MWVELHVFPNIIARKNNEKVNCNRIKMVAVMFMVFSTHKIKSKTGNCSNGDDCTCCNGNEKKNKLNILHMRYSKNSLWWSILYSHWKKN